MANDTSETSDWRRFQSELADLFRVSGYDVTEDILAGHKKVDLLLTERRLGKSSRIAVECKKWSRVLRQKDVSEIYSNYLPLIPTHIDEVLIVTSSGVAESAKAMIASTPCLRAATFSEIHTSIMDFGSYLQGLVAQFNDDGLSKYYVDPLTSEGDDLYSHVSLWIESPCDQPLALLGGYGIGKTTFARRLAYDLAVNAEKDHSARIPVLIRLGEISTEQSIEGLLGKLFTATSLVRNYNFSSFLQLNRLGRFIIIFDGFDEMKQSLTWHSFKYNFSQLNRLVGPRSKVILLGRPTAFLTDAEHDYALHGITQRNAKIYRDPSWPDYREVELAGFSEPQIGAFLSAYLHYLASSAKTEVERKRYEGFAVNVSELMEGNLADIVRRPVQLKMLAEVLPDYRGKKLDALTVHDLYDYFIDFVTDREAIKPERGRFTPKQLRNFAREVAVWLWRQRGSTHTAASLIPRDIIERYRAPADDFDMATRDLIVSSLLDRRPGSPFFFPHRSFQEFLVAEGIFLSIIDRTLEFSELDNILTPQVAEFLTGFPSERLLSCAAAGLERFRGPLPLLFVNVLLTGGDPLKHYPSGSLWGLLVAAIGLKLGKVGSREMRMRLREVQSTTRDPRILLATIYVSLVAARSWRNPQDDEPSRLVSDTILYVINYLKSMYSRRSGDSGDGSLHLGELYDLVAGLVTVHNEGAYAISEAAYRRLHQGSKDVCYIADWTDGRQLLHHEAGLPVKITDTGNRVRVAVESLADLRARVAAPTRPGPELAPIRVQRKPRRRR